MKLVPSGNKRVMEAQSNFGDQTSNWDTMSPSREEEGSAVDAATSEITENLMAEDQQQQQNQENTEDDITTYIFDALTGFGYPPRRLEEYSSEFVHEKIFPEGAKEITIVIPDRYYGSKGRLKSEDLTNVINGIQEKFGLTFIEAERNEAKVTIKFNSEGLAASDDEGDGLDDPLSQVYGPSKNKAKSKKKSKKSALTMNEMMKISKSHLADNLLTTNGDTNGFTTK